MEEILAVERSDALDWRDIQRAKVVEVLNDRLPGLLRSVDKTIEEMTWWQVIRPAKFEREKIAPIAQHWMAEQYRKIHAAVGISSKEDATFANRWDAGFSWEWEDLAAGAGALLAVAPIVLIPAAVVAATVGRSGCFQRPT